MPTKTQNMAGPREAGSALLAGVQVLAIDCQTTGASPQKGYLLEVGWQKTDGLGLLPPAPVESHLLQLPPQCAIPKTVTRITGISGEDLKDGICPAALRRRLIRVMGEVSAFNGTSDCPAVIHFSRFEKPFLESLLGCRKSEGWAPLRIICTHEITRRLLPELPRKGLRAVAGYFGHSMPEHRRAADHVIATASIWRHLVERLTRCHGIQTLAQLKTWLSNTPPEGALKRGFPMDPALRKGLPNAPGVYRMRRSDGSLLYVGKATSLKKRVASYFRPNGSQPEHILEMLSQARNLDYTPSGSALEAAVRESDEIKRHSPPYNVALRLRGRRIAFFSENLCDRADRASTIHTVGPLPGGRAAETVRALGILLAGGFAAPASDEAPEIWETLDPPPGTDCRRRGIERFLSTYGGWIEKRRPLRGLLAAGARIQRERMAALDQPPDDADTAAAADVEMPADRFFWTPETVAGFIAGAFCRSARWVRRARWMCLLSEAGLVWESRTCPDSYHMLVLSSGRMVSCVQTNAADRLSLPPGRGKAIDGRRACFDVATYDRLRVVTTELRRLAAEQRPAWLSLGIGRPLHGPRLSKLLKWV